MGVLRGQELESALINILISGIEDKMNSILQTICLKRRVNREDGKLKIQKELNALTADQKEMKFM